MLYSYAESLLTVFQIDRRKNLRRVLSYLCRGIFRPLAALRWAYTLRCEIDTAIQLIRPRLILKPYRRYINRHFDWNDRTTLILAHYREEPHLFAAEVMERLGCGLTVTFWRHDAEMSGSPIDFRLTLERTSRFDREGELLLSLNVGESGPRIMSAAFSIGYSNEQRSLYVGCIQGGSSEATPAHIKRATRAMFGIRPKNLVLEALCALSTEMRAKQLICSGNRSRVFNSEYVHSDYDAFWKELGGQPGDKDTYVIAGGIPYRDPALVPSRKRAEYRRRRDLLDSLQAAVHLLCLR